MFQRKIIILSGGAGTRLWPLSRTAFPKQFHSLAADTAPLLVETLRRLEGFGRSTIITIDSLKASTQGLLKHYGVVSDVIGEPQPRNTAPAILLATLMAYRENPKTLIGVFPADHLIKDNAKFREVLEFGFKEAEKGEVVTLGIHPDHPSTAYGYIELECASGSEIKALRVNRFIEKPSREKAEQLLLTGKFVWNAGMFLFRADVMKSLFEKHLPEMMACFSKLKIDLSNLPEVYASVKGESVDFGVMEKLTTLLCLPADIGWSDIGSWEEIAKRTETLGRPIQVEGQNNFYTGLMREGKRVAFVGVSDLVAVDTPDALLIAKKGHGQGVKEVVEKLKREGGSLTESHLFEERPWGRFEVLMDTDHFKSKLITVLPKQKLSYQSHAKRAENWTIVRGTAEVTLNDVKHSLKVGDHIFIPLGAKHRIANPGETPMEFIEVQTGVYFGEDDIVRYSDDYGRTADGKPSAGR